MAKWGVIEWPGRHGTAGGQIWGERLIVYSILQTAFFHGTEREQRKVVWIWTVLGLSWPCKLFYFYFPILSSMRVGQEWLEYVPSKANNTYGKGIGSMCHE